MVVVGAWWHLLGGAEDTEECDIAPPRSPTNPLPPNLPQLAAFFVAPLPPTAVPPPLVNWLILVTAAPGKGKRVCHKGQT